MPETPDLAAAFLAHVRGRLVPPAQADGLNRVLAQALERAQARWPGVKLAPELFMTHLAERLPGSKPQSTLEERLGQLCVEELYLACACLHQVPLAAKTFEQHYLRKLPRLLRHRERSVEDIDEICQRAIVQILVPAAGRPPKIAEYKGEGDLQNWVRIIAVRIGIKLHGQQKPTVDPDDEIMDRISGGDPVDGFIKRHHREDLRHAFREAFASLSEEDRYRLRLYYVDRLSMYEMAPLLRTSQPTISRRMDQIRERIGTEIRRHLQARLGLSPQDFQSFMKLVDSQFDLHLSQLLRQPTDPEDRDPPRPSR